MNNFNAGKTIFQRFSCVVFLLICGFATAFGQIDPRLGPLAKPDPKAARDAQISSVCTSTNARAEYKALVDHMMLFSEPNSISATFTLIKTTFGDGSMPEAEAMSKCLYVAADFERCRILTAKNFPSWDVSDGTITTEDGLKFKMTSIGNHAWTGVLVQKGTTYILTAVLYRAKGVIELGTELLD